MSPHVVGHISNNSVTIPVNNTLETQVRSGLDHYGLGGVVFPRGHHWSETNTPRNRLVFSVSQGTMQLLLETSGGVWLTGQVTLHQQV